MRYVFILVIFSATVFIVSYFLGQNVDRRLLQAANNTIDAYEDSLTKLGAILADADIFKLENFTDHAPTNDANYWTGGDEEFDYVYFEYLILRFNKDGYLVDIRPNTL